MLETHLHDMILYALAFEFTTHALKVFHREHGALVYHLIKMVLFVRFDSIFEIPSNVVHVGFSQLGGSVFALLQVFRIHIYKVFMEVRFKIFLESLFVKIFNAKLRDAL